MESEIFDLAAKIGISLFGVVILLGGLERSISYLTGLFNKA